LKKTASMSFRTVVVASARGAGVEDDDTRADAELEVS
jgi:hypothetical protein